eukprot:scaffold9352_cov35-Prasinocladus_malaysianus.AAC.2
MDARDALVVNGLSPITVTLMRLYLPVARGQTSSRIPPNSLLSFRVRVRYTYHPRSELMRRLPRQCPAAKVYKYCPSRRKKE